MTLPSIAEHRVLLDQCFSTSNYIATLHKTKELPYGLTVLTKHQTNGRGQRGSLWYSGQAKNVALSIYLNNKHLKLEHLYLLNAFCANAVFSTVRYFLPKAEVKIKWPNDVMVGERKIAGILVENTWQQRLCHYVCGIGLNINERHFPAELQNQATSLALELNQLVPFDDVLEKLVSELNYFHRLLILGNGNKVKKFFEENLLGLNQTRSFEGDNGSFKAEVIGITLEGLLRIKPDEADAEEKYVEPKRLKWCLKPAPLANDRQ